MQNFSINPQARLSKIDQIVNSIIMDVEKGVLATNERLPSINEFSKNYGVARDTVEKAYIKLKTEGYIDSIAGKGYYILAKQDTRMKVLFAFNKLSSYKKEIYDAFVHTLGNHARVEIFVHHYSPALLKEYLESNTGKYHYYVIMPHFFQHADEAEYLDVLNSIPKNQLILLDKNMSQLSDIQGAVYQDFKYDIYDALKSAESQLKKYRSITVIFPEHANHPNGINEGVKQFCEEKGMDFSVVSHPHDSPLTLNNVYIVLTESDLAILIKKIRLSDFKLGKNIGVISFNETVFKELLEITVITTDFEKMGITAAQLILNKQSAMIRNPFKLIRRSSL